MLYEVSLQIVKFFVPNSWNYAAKFVGSYSIFLFVLTKDRLGSII